MLLLLLYSMLPVMMLLLLLLRFLSIQFLHVGAHVLHVFHRGCCGHHAAVHLCGGVWFKDQVGESGGDSQRIRKGKSTKLGLQSRSPATRHVGKFSRLWERQLTTGRSSGGRRRRYVVARLELGMARHGGRGTSPRPSRHLIGGSTCVGGMLAASVALFLVVPSEDKQN
jgi:hypothetical protein